MPRLFLRPILASLALLPVVAGCTATKDQPPCPPVYILSDASHVTHFRPGPGHDLTDVDVQAEIIGFHGECGFKERAEGGDVKVSLQVAFDVKRGPANTSHKADLTYFVAIPAFYPQDQAKAVFPVTIEFPEGLNDVRHVDQAVAVTIPVKSHDLINKYEVYLGFQTSADELEHNRASK